MNARFAQALLPAGYNAAEVVALTKTPAAILALLLVVLVAQLALHTWALRGTPPATRATLFALRVAATLGIALLLFEPGLRLMATTQEKNRVVIALDTSGSMDAAESGTDVTAPAAAAPGAAPREGTRMIAAARAALALQQSVAARDGNFIPELWTFGSTWQRATAADIEAYAAGTKVPDAPASLLTLPLQALSPAGASADAPAAVPSPASTDSPLGGVVLVTDGADTSGLTAALTTDVRKLAQTLGATGNGGDTGEGAPLHTVLVGDAQAYVDVALHKHSDDAFAFVRNKLTIEIDVTHKGFVGATLPLELREDGKPVARTTVVLGEGPATAKLELEPQRAGKRIYTVVAPVLDGETVSENNRLDFTLELIRDRIRVLQVVGRPSWDERFVRRLLKENPSVDLISFFILRTPTDLSGADNRELSLIPFPTRELFTEQLSTFDVVIFQDFNYGPYQMGMYLQNVKDFVTTAGGGFLMIGGDLSFSEGGYEGTPIADILPVTLLPGSGHTSNEPFLPVLTDAGRTHPIMRIGDMLGGAAGQGPGLPELEGLNLVAGLAPGAETLLGHPFLNINAGATSKPAPVVAVREVGKGRSMAVLTDSTWLWSLPHVGAGGRGDAHRRFFANALRWLIRDPELSRVKLTVDLPDAAAGIEPGTPIPLDVRSFGPTYQPEGQATVKLALTPLDPVASGTPEPPIVIDGTTDNDGAFRTLFVPPHTGAWRAHVEATRGTEALGSDEDAFVVRASATERLHREPQPELLAALAAAGGGRMVAATDITALDFLDRKVTRVERQNTAPLWNRGFVLLATAVLAGLEWWLRRRRGFA